MTYMFKRLTPKDLDLAMSILGGPRDPNLTIAPDGNPYLYRWNLVRGNASANVYFHIQTASDPDRPLHDHPWDNTSVILSGGYTEIMEHDPGELDPVRRTYIRVPGDMISRKADEAHRLVLPTDIPYTMTIFTTGPKIREWGFWYPQGWVHNYDVVLDRPDGVSIFREVSTSSFWQQRFEGSR